jgi:hypothetical protein
MDLIAPLVTNVSALGLIYDGVGVFVLGVPAMLSTTADIRQMSGTAWGYNPQLIRATVRLRLDTGTGALFLIAGFLLQLFGALGVQLSPIPGSFILGALVALSLSYGLWFRGRLTDTWVNSIVAGIEAQLEEQRAARKAR